MEFSGQLQAPAALSPGKDPGTHWTRDWVGFRDGLDTPPKGQILCRRTLLITTTVHQLLIL